jgi:N6-adenosine-specific RNA methylase IME4
MTQYGVLYADPPWSFTVRSPKGKGRSAEAYYDTLSLDGLKALRGRVDAWAARDCVLLMWASDPMLDQAVSLIDAWGFTFKTVGFYWAKTLMPERALVWDEEKAKIEIRWAMGCGYWTRANPEQCLLATRGHPKPQAHDVRRLVVSPRRKHSQKPEEVYGRIERLCAGPYLEMFARERREGWDAWGNEVDSGPAARRWKAQEAA